MITKKEAAARKAAWTKALAEGRVVRYNVGTTFQSFTTVQEAHAFARTVNAAAPGDAVVVLGHAQSWRLDKLRIAWFENAEPR